MRSSAPARRWTRPYPRPAAASTRGPEERALLERFVTAFSELDVDALVAMMTDDSWVRMPPLPFEYRGTEAVHRFFTATEVHRRGIVRMVPVRANGQPAWGEYSRDPVTGRYVWASRRRLAGDRLSEIIRFETDLAPYFGLPRTLD